MITPGLYDSRFMRAARREPTDTTPVWLMRQAGRFMPEYRAIRGQMPFLEFCKRPDLAAEATLVAQRSLGVDAAILFADLAPILEPMGFQLDYAPGPVIANPVRDARDVDRVREIDDVSALGYVFETARRVRSDLPANIPLLGFAGAPFTLASYAIEGAGSRHYIHTKSLMYNDPAAWAEFMRRLAGSVVRYLRAQIDAGCQAVQLFDSWAGCLSPSDYRTFALPYTRTIVDGLPPDVPIINFLTGNPALLPLLREAGGQVMGVDWRIDLDAAWQLLGHDVAVQGNLDPVALFAEPDTLRDRVRNVMDAARKRTGHIFNLGHGVLPGTNPDRARALVDMVHEMGGH